MKPYFDFELETSIKYSKFKYISHSIHYLLLADLAILQSNFRIYTLTVLEFRKLPNKYTT